jgi:ABC-type Fe3+/spermidine/putrescine transport system ATPase subunit
MTVEPDRLISISKTSSRRADERVNIQWDAVTFETAVKDSERSTLLSPIYRTKKILRGLSGSATSGQLIAILGPTGCGKTSLMNVLAGRVPSGGQKYHTLTGNIYMNGKKRDEEKFRKISAYVMQVMLPEFVV